MGSLTRTLVVLLVATPVLCSPLINKLQPGQEWPKRQSVKQPFQDETVAANQSLNEITTERAAEELEYETADSSDIDSPETIFKAVDLGKQEPEKIEPEKVDYSGAQLWKVRTEKTGVKTTLNRLRRRNLISTWGGSNTTIDILVKSNAIQNVTRVFARDSIPYNVVIEDLQKVINDENPPLDENELELQDRRARAHFRDHAWRFRAPPRRIGLISAYMGYNALKRPMEYWPHANWGHRMTWKQYHRLEDIHGFMDYLAKTYPSLVSVNSIGKSHEGRDLKVLRISNGNPTNKAVFIDGGIHAREWISPATVTYFINQFAENFDIESEDVKNIDWYFLPVVNPDGYEYTHTTDRLWRKNKKPGYVQRCSGADLNRNFGYRWGGRGASANPCSEIYRGNRAFSEPESKALSDFIKTSASNFTAYLTYHSYGQYILYPWGYDNVLPPDHEMLDSLGKRMAQAVQQAGGSQYTVGSSSGLLYPAAGGSDDWAKSQGIKYTYTIELSDTGRYGFILPTSYIETVAKESLAGLRVLAKEVHL